MKNKTAFENTWINFNRKIYIIKIKNKIESKGDP